MPEPAGEAEEDGLGLVVAGVAEQDGGRGRGARLRRPARRTWRRGPRLRAAFAADGHGDGLDGAEVHRGEPGDHLGGADVGAV